jgi:phenylalanyl-tRNA synthetase beta subunit
VSFWVDKEKGFNNNDFFEIVRGIGGDLVEQVGPSRKHPYN